LAPGQCDFHYLSPDGAPGRHHDHCRGRGSVFIVQKNCGRVCLERFLIFLVPVPYLANELGWIGTEVGRQPWVIYKVLHTAKASSMLIPSWQIATTLSGICLLYACLLTLTVVFVRRTIKEGFDKE
jgi:cytochrome bd-type quinol oxidase subunit 1